MFNFLSKGVYSIYSKAYRKGKNSYFILEPGYQVVLEGEEDSEKLQLVMSVLNETKIVLNDTLATPAGTLSNVLETNPLKPGEKEFKFYAHGIGLIQDEALKLVKYIPPSS